MRIGLGELRKKASVDAGKLSIHSVFDKTERLEAPLFQRPYVWNKQDNWEPLWWGIRTVAERRLSGQTLRPHFLGAIVLDQLKTATGRVHARQIIDGQQRLTTLQLAMVALQDLCTELGIGRYAASLRKLTSNSEPLCTDPDEDFKVWPTNADRDDFRLVMTVGSAEAVRRLPHADPEDTFLIPDAYLYFYDAFRAWLLMDGQERIPERIRSLHDAIREDLHLVVIDLDRQDDSQEIFETLNALGTPLLPADLVKNFLFHRAQGQEVDMYKLYRDYWQVFDDEREYWRKEIRSGRLKRPRLDMFLGHYLTMLRGEETLVSQLFTTYRDMVSDSGSIDVREQMEHFRRYADVYRSFDSFPWTTREGEFFYRLEQMDTSTVYPVLLEVFHMWGDKPDKLGSILADIESYLVRRAVCGLTTRGYNKVFAELVKFQRQRDDFSPVALRGFLVAQTSDAARWPDDAEFESAWMTTDFYHGIHRATARMVFESLESALYTGKTEWVDIDRHLTIEHILPREWEKNWPLPTPADDPIACQQARQKRESLLHRAGNLTLVTKKLNPALSNGPWTKKRREILKHSALNLNRVLDEYEDWNETAIEGRTVDLYKLALRIWGYPGRPTPADVVSVPVLADAQLPAPEPEETPSPASGDAKRRHAEFWQAVTDQFNAIGLVVGETIFRVNQRRPWYYLQIRAGSRYLHYEWQVRKRPRQVDVALHFEHSDLKQNLRLLDAIKDESAAIGKGVPWAFAAEPWGTHWASARYAVPYSNDSPSPEEVPVVVEAMKALIERTWPAIRTLLR